MDAETSLYYVRNRWYDATVSWFVSEDPTSNRYSTFGGYNFDYDKRNALTRPISSASALSTTTGTVIPFSRSTRST